MVCESESLQCANYWECDCAQDMSFDNQCTRDYSTDFQFVFTAETCDSKKSCLQAVYDASIIQEVIVLQAISSLIECLPQENTNASGEDGKCATHALLLQDQFVLGYGLCILLYV